MSHHSKVHSQRSVPFSWEDSPGVSKATPQECAENTGVHGLNLSPSHSPPAQLSVQQVKIPLPPCPSQPPRRSASSSKGFWGQEEADPFLAAYKECTKSVVTSEKPEESKKGFGFGRKKCKLMFSCRHSCDVEDDSLIRPTHLPPLPKVKPKVRGLRLTERPYLNPMSGG